MTYTLDDIVQVGSCWGCPVPGCRVTPWATRDGMLRNHANREHQRCQCGWVGRKVSMHMRHVGNDGHGLVEILPPPG